MRLSKGSDNKIKNGRVWLYLTKDSKSIGLEWSFRPWNILTCNISFDGGEGDWTLNFWFIFEFWITFSNIFKWYPKEWNSCVNDGKGGWLNSATRKIGISQWDWSLTCYVWHDGDDSWYPDKENKLWYKYINFYDIITGGHCYKTIDEKENDIYYINLPEGKMEIELTYRYWHKTYKRFYCKPFQTKGKNVRIESKIKYPRKKYTEDDKKDGYKPESFESTMESKWYTSKKDEDVINIALSKYKEDVIKLRMVESSKWVPYEYRKRVQREEKLKRVINDILL